MTLAQIIQSAIDVAMLGTDPDASPVQKSALELESAVDIALHELSGIVRGNPRVRARLTKEFSVALVSGVGAVPATVLIEFIGEGIVRDGDSGANDGYGNILQRVHNETDFRGYLNPVYGYYNIKGDTSGVSQIYTRTINTGTFVDTVTPLTITAPYTPAKADLNTALDGEISDELIQLLAAKLRGAPAEAA